jgi:subtilisin family serine protease
VIAKKRELGGRWIVNCSFGVPNSPQFADAYARMIAEGILVVAAAGNHERGQSPIVLYPANFPDVLGVGAVDQRRQLAPFSNPGPKISVVAPGRNVVSTYSRDQGDVPSVSANGKIWYGIRVLGYYAPEVRTGEGVLVDCGIGRPEDFPQDKSGYTAVIRSSSTLTLNRIGHNAVAAGAGTIVFIYSDFEPQRWTFQSADDPNAKSFPWPLTVALNEDDGYELSQSIGAQAALDDRFGDYGVTSGTSFASPHVAGVAALLWSLAPNATAAELRKAITATAHDMGTPGWDEATGYGLVDAAAAARYLAPEKFPLSGRRVLKH